MLQLFSSLLALLLSFTHDNLGFLRWETHPEKTANSFGQGHDVDIEFCGASKQRLRS